MNKPTDFEAVQVKYHQLADFHPGSITHATVVCTVIVIAAVMTQLGRKQTSTTGHRAVDRQFARFLYLVCLVVFLRDLRPDRISWNESLPLHICDITGLIAAVAIQTGRPFARRLLHFWGLALSSQAFFFPVLNAGPIHSDFWLYWIEHAAIVLAAIYDLTVNNYRPTWRDWRLATLYLAIYAAIIVPINAKFNFNYGYLGKTLCAQRSAIAVLGPWPDRLPAIWLACIAVMALLKLCVTVRLQTTPRSNLRHAPLALPQYAIPSRRAA